MLNGGSGTPLVLVHGSVLDYRSWRSVIDKLASRHHVIVPNLRHYYPEPWKGDGQLSPEQQANDLAALAKALKLGKAHWIGWSRGGIVIVERQIDRELHAGPGADRPHMLKPPAQIGEHRSCAFKFRRCAAGAAEQLPLARGTDGAADRTVEEHAASRAPC
jgi:hypothetical protein